MSSQLLFVGKLQLRNSQHFHIAENEPQGPWDVRFYAAPLLKQKRLVQSSTGLLTKAELQKAQQKVS